MQQQTEVSQHLELLADFVSDVPVVGMKLLQFTIMSINVGGRKFIN